MPQQYGKWEIVKPLGEGGQAHTYLVREVGSPEQPLFVLKRLKNRNRLDRFETEVKAGLALHHPNILEIVDQDLEHEKPYFVAEYCAGGSLADTDLSHYTIVEKLELFAAICRGVGFAHTHAAPVIHRDLKPDNIFLRADLRTPVVGDFGLCLITEEGVERLTHVEEAVGSRWYMAPELAHGKAEDITPAADVYSLGKVLYWMLAKRIFDREVHRSSQYDLTKEQTLPDYFFVYDLLDRMIVEDPSKRLTNAAMVADAIETIIRRIVVRAHHLDLSTPQACIYCGIGFYQEAAHGPTRENVYPLDYSEIEHFGGLKTPSSYNTPISSWPVWLILTCDHCGNVQMFRPDFAKDRNVWKRRQD